MSCQDNEDFAIDCQSSGILFKNIMFEQEGEGGLKGMLIIHNGQTTLEDCQLKCGITGVYVMKHGHLLMRNCKLYDAKVCLNQSMFTCFDQANNHWHNVLQS